MSALSNWLNILRRPVPNFADNETPAGVIDGTNVTFTLQHAPNPTSGLLLFVNNIRANEGQDFNIQGTTLTMLFTPSPGNAPNGLAPDQMVAFYRY